MDGYVKIYILTSLESHLIWQDIVSYRLVRVFDKVLLLVSDLKVFLGKSGVIF